jgi:hypothetical protein
VCAGGWAELAQAYVWKLFLFALDEKDLQQKAFVAVEKPLALSAIGPDLKMCIAIKNGQVSPYKEVGENLICGK